MKWIRDRILKNKVTSALGIVFLIACTYLMVWKGKATFEEIGSFLGVLGTFLVGIYNLFAKDPKRFQKKEEQYRDEASKMSSSDLARATDDLLSSAAFSKDHDRFVRIDPTDSNRILVIEPGQIFHNTTTQDYFAWPRKTHEKGYARIKLSYDLQNEVKKNNLIITILKFAVPVAFAGGLVAGVYIAK